MTLSLEEIKLVLPHREPFLMIDRVTDYEPGKFCKAVRAVNANEWFFQGHFEKQKVFPGVLIVESLAQCGAIAVLTAEEYKGKIAVFRSIESMKFKKMVVPGDLLEVETEITLLKRGIGKGSGVARVNGEIAAVGELSFVVM
ncbi:MAG TPA: 3-hydroxyacyl-ACP dehydratase FabZ [Armatimonadota bacterium]|nr:3-hydroxyacyl-ACP dehydratase FabZ [Armatimonadota bacterium]